MYETFWETQLDHYKNLDKKFLIEKMVGLRK